MFSSMNFINKPNFTRICWEHHLKYISYIMKYVFNHHHGSNWFDTVAIFRTDGKIFLAKYGIERNDDICIAQHPYTFYVFPTAGLDMSTWIKMDLCCWQQPYRLPLRFTICYFILALAHRPVDRRHICHFQYNIIMIILSHSIFPLNFTSRFILTTRRSRKRRRHKQ